MRYSSQDFIALSLRGRGEKLVSPLIVNDTFERGGAIIGRLETDKAKLVLPFAAKPYEELCEVERALGGPKKDLATELRDVERWAMRLAGVFGVFKERTEIQGLDSIRDLWGNYALNRGLPEARDVNGTDLANLVPATLELVGQLARKHRVNVGHTPLKKGEKPLLPQTTWCILRTMLLPRTTDPAVLAKFDPKNWERRPAEEFDSDEALITQSIWAAMGTAA